MRLGTRIVRNNFFYYDQVKMHALSDSAARGIVRRKNFNWNNQEIREPVYELLDINSNLDWRNFTKQQWIMLTVVFSLLFVVLAGVGTWWGYTKFIKNPTQKEVESFLIDYQGALEKQYMNEITYMEKLEVTPEEQQEIFEKNARLRAELQTKYIDTYNGERAYFSSFTGAMEKFKEEDGIPEEVIVSMQAVKNFVDKDLPPILENEGPEGYTGNSRLALYEIMYYVGMNSGMDSTIRDSKLIDTELNSKAPEYYYETAALNQEIGYDIWLLISDTEVQDS